MEPTNINVNNMKFESDDLSEVNEIELIKRTIENNTHEVFEDLKIKRITSWRKSHKKFKKNLIFNILSFGILHLVSIFNPNIYIKLYCVPWTAKECDFFLVENIYGNLTLCEKIYKKDKNANKNDNEIDKGNLRNINNNIKSAYNNLIKHVTYSFEYKSCLYEYNEKTNQIFPIYMNLSKMLNKDIFNFFSDGLSSLSLVETFKKRYGQNKFKLNLKIIYLYFLKTQIPSLAIIIIIALIEFIALKNYLTIFIKIALAIAILVIQLIIDRINFINKYKNEFTLDGKDKKVRVKRDYLLKNDYQLYDKINIIELLPGDIILLKNDDYIPCDCIVIRGECLVSDSDLTGSLNIYKKIALKNNSEYFKYKNSNINILYHGMKIINSFSKTDRGYILALCINTGPNTFKANLYSNSLDFFERKKEYNNVYNLFGERKKIFLYMAINIVILIIIGFIYYYEFLEESYKESDFFKENFGKSVVVIISKTLMAIFFSIQNILIFFALLQLYKLNIVCFDKSRLIKSGKINTIIFNKTETLSENYLEIEGYHPISLNINKPNQFIFKHYSKSQSKYLSNNIFAFYQNYILGLINIKNENKYLLNNLNNPKKAKFLFVLFFECLLSCNSIEKNDMDFFGNNIEVKLFDDIKWSIKQYEENINNNYLKIKFPNIGNLNNSKLIEHYYYITRKIVDIFPKNYYKLEESLNDNVMNQKINQGKIKLSRINTINTLTSDDYFYTNQVQLDITNANIHSYKLRIYKKFIFNGSLSSASITYNFLTKELRFMIKAFPEDVIDKCDRNSIPKDFEKIISINRKNGCIILVCATKKIELEEYHDTDDLEKYIDDLTFLGFITLENKIKGNVTNSIKELRKFNDNFKIVSGDNVYNCLSTGFKSGIIEDRNIFVLDTEDISNKITIRKICSFKYKEKSEDEKEDDISKLSELKSVSQVTKNINQSKELGNNKKKFIRNNNKKYSIINNQFNNNFNKENLISEINNLPPIEDFIDKERKNVKEPTGKRKVNKEKSELFNGNSEYERIINKEKLDKIDTNQEIPDNNSPFQNSLLTKIKTDITRNSKINIEKSLLNEEENEYKYLAFMEKYYYHDIYKEYDDVKNGIFCISGNFLNYLNSIIEHKGVKNFMEKVIEKTKIFFDMSSNDKCLLVDFFKESPKNIVCVIGQSDSDIYSILSSDIGINLKNPINMNTILCHYYSEKKDISCIKDIMIVGKVFYEDNVLLESMSFVCTLVLNGYILCSIIKNVDINIGEINFLEIEFFILATLSFLGKTKENIYTNQNSNLLNFYYYLQLGENISFKILGFLLFALIFEKDYSFDDHEVDKEFLSYFFVLCTEFLICGILSFNFISFYKESAFNNFYLIFFILVFFLNILFLLFTNSSNYSRDLFSITKFIYNEKIMDSFSDRNRAFLLVALLFDFFGTVLMNMITYVIFNCLIN